MQKDIIVLLEDAKRKMSGYAALLNYRLMNLSIKADPEALLSVMVTVEGKDEPIETVARSRNADGREDQFEIYPLERSLLFPVVKGLAKAHPEFDVELHDIEGGEEGEQYILATMPVVDDMRHDVLMEGVKALSDFTEAKIEAVFTACGAKIAVKMVGAEPEEIDEAKNALGEVHDFHTDLCKQFRQAKEDEIEQAYKLWQDQQAQAKASKKEEDAAHNIQAGMQMKFGEDTDE